MAALLIPQADQGDVIAAEWRFFPAEAPCNPVDIVLDEHMLHCLYEGDEASWGGLIDYIEHMLVDQHDSDSD